MDNKKDILRVTMKDINLLPEDILAASSNSMEKRRTQSEVNESEKVTNESDSKVPPAQSEKSKEGVVTLSKTLKDNLIDSIHQNSDRATSFLNSLKKDKIRNLERILGVDKKDLSFSNKKNYIYSTGSGRMVIIDRDIWGEPCTVTVKEANDVAIRRVKFFEDEPFLFPVFNEKNLTGDVIHMDDNEIWYLYKDEATIVLFKNDKPDFLKVSLKNFKNINNKKALHTYLDSSKMLYLDKKLHALLIEDRNIQVEDIIKIRAGYAVYKNTSRTYKVLLFDEFRQLYDEFTFSKLPSVREDGWDVLFSKDIVDYVKANNYSFENFRQDDGHIEYWQNIGAKRVCVLRCKI
ncbi:hypothetical protein [Acetivibrio cellulolyticus]|uniref:hypothetical protein n=1 Tax=Acetivibrio cellulolyticus TaxID=35830 RepID=UPI0002481B65|nr:hypothetical protein [Acetivibrio cellulolyticus]